jgi:hypothetical protein
MQYTIQFVCLLLCAAIAVSGCTKDGDLSETKLTAQRVKMDDIAAFPDVIGPGLTTTPDGKTVSFDVFLLGQLSLPSGQIVAADGFIMDRIKPFTRSVKPGSYPMTVAVARLGNDQRIAFAQIRFSDRSVARWEMALTPGQDPAKLKAGEIYCFGVDSGTGSFADPGAQEILSGRDSDDVFDQATAEMKKVYEPTRDWVLIDMPKGSAALFSSGWGDGRYASYFGLDEADNPVALMTDFGVVDWKRRP